MPDLKNLAIPFDYNPTYEPKAPHFEESLYTLWHHTAEVDERRDLLLGWLHNALFRIQAYRSALFIVDSNKGTDDLRSLFMGLLGKGASKHAVMHLAGDTGAGPRLMEPRIIANFGDGFGPWTLETCEFLHHAIADDLIHDWTALTGSGRKHVQFMHFGGGKTYPFLPRLDGVPKEQIRSIFLRHVLIDNTASRNIPWERIIEREAREILHMAINHEGYRKYAQDCHNDTHLPPSCRYTMKQWEGLHKDILNA